MLQAEPPTTASDKFWEAGLELYLRLWPMAALLHVPQSAVATAASLVVAAVLEDPLLQQVMLECTVMAPLLVLLAEGWWPPVLLLTYGYGTEKIMNYCGWEHGRVARLLCSGLAALATARLERHASGTI